METKNNRMFSSFYPEGTSAHRHRASVMARLESMLELAQKNSINLWSRKLSKNVRFTIKLRTEMCS